MAIKNTMIIVSGRRSVKQRGRSDFHDLCLIDVAKFNHFAYVVSSDGDVLLESFYNSQITLRASVAFPLCYIYNRDQPLMGFESTAHYGNDFFMFCVIKGYQFLSESYPYLGYTKEKRSLLIFCSMAICFFCKESLIWNLWLEFYNTVMPFPSFFHGGVFHIISIQLS